MKKLFALVLALALCLSAFSFTAMAEFDGVRLNVVSEGDFVQSGTPVQIIRVDGGRILVRTI